ncbi:30S ribosomal protein S4 [Candidatus Micrarchaeota archaeon]|nr:30S ribosomal protein S4 [Candidatus Micrarchaeota archaeon]
MGDPKKNKKKYESPRKVWDLTRIVKEQGLLEEYGLRSMRELWAVEQELKKIRREARRLLPLGERGETESRKLLTRTARLGLTAESATLDDLLSLKVQDLLDRRLESQVFKRGLAKSMKQSRQIIVHGFVAVNGKRICAPNYIVPVSEEKAISYYKPINLNPEPLTVPTRKSREVEGKIEETPASGEGETPSAEAAS